MRSIISQKWMKVMSTFGINPVHVTSRMRAGFFSLGLGAGPSAARASGSVVGWPAAFASREESRASQGDQRGGEGRSPGGEEAPSPPIVMLTFASSLEVLPWYSERRRGLYRASPLLSVPTRSCGSGFLTTGVNGSSLNKYLNTDAISSSSQ